jgi:hypothetical protein
MTLSRFLQIISKLSRAGIRETWTVVKLVITYTTLLIAFLAFVVVFSMMSLIDELYTIKVKYYGAMK